MGEIRPRVALAALSTNDAGHGGGTERACAELLRRGCESVDFVVVSSDIPDDLRERVRWQRVPLPRRPAFVRDLVFFVVAGWKLRALDVDLTHAMGAIVPNRISLSWVHFCHLAFRPRSASRVPQGASTARRLSAAAHRLFAESAERWVYRPGRVSCLAAASAGVADELREHFRVRDVVVVPNGVDLDRFRSDPAVRRSVRAETATDEREQIVLFVGGDWSRKGLEVVIRAVGEVRRDGVPLTLWVLGRGDERAFTELAAGCGAADAIRFFGRREDTERFYAAADIFVIPSSYETFSLVAYEAAAAGLPVVGTRVSGVAELILEGGGGILVAPELEPLADALRRLSRDSEERRRLGALARRWAERFAWDDSVTTMLRIYERLQLGTAP